MGVRASNGGRQTPAIVVRSIIQFLPELASFALLLCAARLEGWTPGDLAWGLWLSSFMMIITWLVLMAMLSIRADRGRLGRTAGALLAVGLTGWATVWLYRFYGEMLDLGFPLPPDPGRVHVGGTTWRNVRPFALAPTLVAGLRQYWIVVVVSLLPLIPGLLRTWPDADAFRRDPGFRAGAFARLHLTIMALMALQIFVGEAADGHAFLFSAAILTINYFPWPQDAAATQPGRRR